MAKLFSGADLDRVEYQPVKDGLLIRFFEEWVEVGVEEWTSRIAATLKIDYVNLSYYAKKHLDKRPPLCECGVTIQEREVQKFLIPTGRTRLAGNGSIAVKYYDVSKVVKDDEVERFERVGIRLPTGVLTYAFFETTYLTRAEDPRRGALFLIDPSKMVVQSPMSDEQKQEFQTFGGRKILYFDVLDAPNLKERKEEIQRCRIRGAEKRQQHDKADRKWESEMQERLERKAKEEAEKPRLSKKAKQKARKKAKSGQNVQNKVPMQSLADYLGCVDRLQDSDGDSDVTVFLGPVDEGEQERLHKLKQAESKAKAEEESRVLREAEATKRKQEAVEAKRKADADAAEARRKAEKDAARIDRMKSLLQKVQSSLKPSNGHASLYAAYVKQDLGTGASDDVSDDSSESESDSDNSCAAPFFSGQGAGLLAMSSNSRSSTMASAIPPDPVAHDPPPGLDIPDHLPSKAPDSKPNNVDGRLVCGRLGVPVGSPVASNYAAEWVATAVSGHPQPSAAAARTADSAA